MKLNPSATPDPVPKIKNIETEGLQKREHHGIQGFASIYVPQSQRFGKRMAIQNKSYQELMAIQNMTKELDQVSSEMLITDGHNGIQTQRADARNGFIRSLSQNKHVPLTVTDFKGIQYKPIKRNTLNKGISPLAQHNTVDLQTQIFEKEANKGKTLLSEKEVENMLQVAKPTIYSKVAEPTETNTRSPFLKSVQKDHNTRKDQPSPYHDHEEDFMLPRKKRDILVSKIG